MIIEPEIRNYNGVTWYEIINTGQPYYALGYTPDKVIRLITAEGEPILSKALASKLNGFGASTYQELIAEGESRGLDFSYINSLSDAGGSN